MPIPQSGIATISKVIKLEKAVAVLGISLGVPEKQKNSGNNAGFFSQIAKCSKFYDFRHRERQTCREPWVDTGLHLFPTFCAGCFLKSTVSAFSSFSEKYYQILPVDKSVESQVKNQCHAEEGATKGGASKCEQTQTNADKC